MTTTLVHARAGAATAEPVALPRARSRSRRRRLFVTGVLSLVVTVLFVASMVVGDVALSVTDVIRSLTARGTPADDFIVHELRLPRTLTGLLVGGAFGLAGGIFQTLVRNPLASPDIIGITWGASAGAVVAIVVFGAVGSVVSLAALVGMSVVMSADLIAVHAMPTSFPVGVVTGLVGGPYLLYVLATSNRVRRNR